MVFFILCWSCRRHCDPIMYREHLHLTQSPFQEEPNPEILFPGGRREEICQSLLLEILAGKPLVKLIGREGAGKTLICRVIIDRLPANSEVVYIDNPVGAFDDLLRLACLDLGMNPIANHESTNFLQELRRLLSVRAANHKKTVLIIDEAEKLFLATLERLVRHVSDHQEDLGLTIMLAGRPGLDANLEQLAGFCATIDLHAGHTLPDLNENETRQYLQYRLKSAGFSREQQSEVFTPGAVARIFAAAQGNIRMINILAEESMPTSCSEKSFMVLLDHVEPAADEREQLGSRVVAIYDLLRHNRRLTVGLALAVVLVLAIGLLLSGNKDSQPPATTTAEKTLKVLPPAEQRDGEKLFRERLGASATWLAGAYRGSYTIQLMVLTSDQAQASITKALIQDDYYLLKDQLYVVRKKTSPPTLFVFYGIFDSLDAAREARNGMPIVLRKHDPYPLSISEALKKLEY